MISFKSCVECLNVDRKVFEAILVAEEIYSNYNTDLVVTSLTDGVHMQGSLHGKGLAVDLRIWNLAGEDVQKVVEDLVVTLDLGYDVVLESDHIHIEYDIK